MDEQAKSALLRAFGERVREARARVGMSQEELADRAGLDRTYISGVERGVRNLSLSTLCRIASALAVDPADLVKRLG